MKIETISDNYNPEAIFSAESALSVANILMAKRHEYGIEVLLEGGHLIELNEALRSVIDKRLFGSEVGYPLFRHGETVVRFFGMLATFPEGSNTRVIWKEGQALIAEPGLSEAIIKRVS